MNVGSHDRLIAAALVTALLTPVPGLAGCTPPASSPVTPTPIPTPVSIGQAQGFAPPDIPVFRVTPSERLAAGQTAHVEWQADADQLVLRVLYHTDSGELLMGDTLIKENLEGSQDILIQSFEGQVLTGAEFSLQAIRSPRDPQTGLASGEPVIVTQSILIPLDHPETPVVTFEPGITPTFVPSPTPTPLPTGFPPEDFNPVTVTPILPLQTPGGPVVDPQIIRFEVTPEDHLDFGQTVTVTWEIKADLASLAYEYATGNGERSYGDSFLLDRLSGSKQIALKPVDSLPYYVAFTLTVLNGEYDPQTESYHNPRQTAHSIPVPLTCPYPWFIDNPPQWCPLTADTPLEGVMQRFQNALLVAIENTNHLPYNGVYVLYTHDDLWVRYSVVEPAYPNVPPSLSGMLVPDPAFYGLWRDGGYRIEPIKSSVGDPTSAATRYEAHTQCEFSPADPSVSQCFINLPDGRIIQLYQNGHFGRNGIVWSEWTGP